MNPFTLLFGGVAVVVMLVVGLAAQWSRIGPGIQPVKVTGTLSPPDGMAGKREA